VELVIGQPRGGGPDAGLPLEMLDFEGLALGFRLGSGREVLPDPFAVQPAGDAINDIPGGIREF
jgi:hypothetical protein